MSYQSWLDKANENLAAAQLCFDNGHFNACANRLYYGMFQAGIAAMVKHGLLKPDAQGGHDWLQSNFSGQLIKHRKVFPAKFRSYLSEAYLLRVVADYERRFAGKDNVSRTLKKAKEFVNTINTEASHATQS
ncbi:HEPN domain-containing protein [candidate division KSB1 bacterium]|nr:HEPN domain-containing protein [candidate division KSB1 bacterium]